MEFFDSIIFKWLCIQKEENSFLINQQLKIKTPNHKRKTATSTFCNSFSLETNGRSCQQRQAKELAVNRFIFMEQLFDYMHIAVYNLLMDTIKDFVYSNQFWMYHGFVLSGLWVLGSAIGIFLKKFSTILHVLTFAIVDFTTLFFAGAALIRVGAHFDKFAEWAPLKQAHVAGGAIFLVLVILQHIGGLTAFLGKKPNPQHRKFGKVLVLIGRAIAAVGWILGGNEQNAMVVAGVSAVLFVLSLVIGGSKPSKKVEASSSGNNRSRSPKGKRQ